MKICFIGKYNRDYIRSRLLIEGAKNKGVEVVEVNIQKTGWKLYFEVFKQTRMRNKDCDGFVVLFEGEKIVPFVRLATRKKIIFDIFCSYFDMYVIDRKLCKRKSLKAYFYLFLGWLSCFLSDEVLAMNEGFRDFFIKYFKVPKIKLHIVRNAAMEEIFYPAKIEQNNEKFIVMYHGGFIPLHGLDYVIEAANKLKDHSDIYFKFLGNGQEYDKITKYVKDNQLKNTEFFGFVEPSVIADNLRTADVVLGIFGTSEKAQMTISLKLYESISVGKASITETNPMTEKVFKHLENIYFVGAGNAQEIVDAILYLKNNNERRKEIGQNAYKLYRNKYSRDASRKDFYKILKEVYG